MFYLMFIQTKILANNKSNQLMTPNCGSQMFYNAPYKETCPLSNAFYHKLVKRLSRYVVIFCL